MNSLLAPFPFEEVEAKVQVVSSDNHKGMAVFYLDSRAIQRRLDNVVGPLNWQNHFFPWQDKAQICGISIYDPERKVWIAKHDGAENSNIEAIKGGLTDAFKRAAVLWGIGRYLYQIKGVWVDVEQRGNSKSSFIKKGQDDKLKAEYEAAVKKIFGPDAFMQNYGDQSASNAGASGHGQVLSVPHSPPDEQKPPENPLPPHDFIVQSIKPAGNGSHLLELCNGSGQITEAYVKPIIDGVLVGAKLWGVELEKKTHGFKDYNIINRYKIAA
jgi:hypothetical protein